MSFEPKTGKLLCVVGSFTAEMEHFFMLMDKHFLIKPQNQ